MQSYLNTVLNKTVSPPLKTHRYNLRIEQYRGLCALLVFVYHAANYEYLVLGHYSLPRFTDILGAGNLSVLIFFCISGYVIGINHDSNKLHIWDYLKKRTVRLFPIYIASVLLCIYVSVKTPLYEIVGNMFFLQNNLPYINIRIPIFTNFSTWSLNYEVLYYILFIPLFYIRPKIWQISLCLLVPTLLFVYCPGNTIVFINYINGYYFWILGLILAWSTRESNTVDIKNTIPLLSLMFLQMCLHHLGIGEMVLHTLGIYTIVNVNWLFDLPFCLMVMCILTGKDNRFLKFNKVLCYILPVFVFAYLVLHHRLTEDVRWIMCLIYWGLSLLFYFERKISGFLMDKLTGVGKISYAIYLLHVPVGLLIRKTVFIQDRTTEIVVKYILWFALTFALSYLLERVMQPAIKRFFFPKPVVQAGLSGT